MTRSRLHSPRFLVLVLGASVVRTHRFNMERTSAPAGDKRMRCYRRLRVKVLFRDQKVLSHVVKVPTETHVPLTVCGQP